MHRLRPITVAALAVSASVGLLLGCTDEGGLSIRLSMPTADELSPQTGDLIAELTLEARGQAGDVQRLTRNLSDSSQGLALGSLEPGESLHIAVELRSVGGQLLGYGRTPSPIEIAAGDSTEVELNVRRPLAYLPNRDGLLLAVDSSRDLASALTAGISVAGTPVASASSADGGDLYVALSSGGTSSLGLVSTSTHRPSRGIAGPLAPAPVDLVLSPDGGQAALAHRTTTAGTIGGVTIVDINGGTSEFIELGDASRLAFDSTGELFVLVGRSKTCLSPARTASIYRLSPGDRESLTELPFSGSASDIAAAQGRLLIAEPCSGEVLTLARGASGPSTFFSAEGASALVASENSITIGAVNAQSAMTITTVDLEGTEINSIALETPMESVVSEDLDAEGQSVRVVVDADAEFILDLATIPGSESIAVLTETFYDIEGGFNIPAMSASVWEYQLIDAASETAVHRIRTTCELDVRLNGEPLENWTCGRASDQIALDPEFRLETISVLYGAR